MRRKKELLKNFYSSTKSFECLDFLWFLSIISSDCFRCFWLTRPNNPVRKVHSWHLDLNICSQPLMYGPTLSGSATEPQPGLKYNQIVLQHRGAEEGKEGNSHTNTCRIKGGGRFRRLWGGLMTHRLTVLQLLSGLVGYRFICNTPQPPAE